MVVGTFEESGEAQIRADMQGRGTLHQAVQCQHRINSYYVVLSPEGKGYLVQQLRDGSRSSCKITTSSDSFGECVVPQLGYVGFEISESREGLLLEDAINMPLSFTPWLPANHIETPEPKDQQARIRITITAWEIDSDHSK